MDRQTDGRAAALCDIVLAVQLQELHTKQMQCKAASRQPKQYLNADSGSCGNNQRLQAADIIAITATTTPVVAY